MKECDMHENSEALCAAWLDAKRDEDAARKRRVEIEAQMAQAFDVPAEGSKTTTLDSYKVTMTQPITRRLDADEWERVKGYADPSMHPVKVKIEADAAGCKYLAKNEPQTWAKIARAFETKPGKVGVKVEAL
jgi:hypothetical protein